MGSAMPGPKTGCDAKPCQKGGGMIVLPLLKDGEQDWPRGLRIVLYLLGLLWAFMGVGVVSDVFMGAIDKITSKKKRVWVASLKSYRTVTIWNDTVANLTLMALGSSAPEILLGVIEICGNDFYAGDLGPSTIVGSAAFNLFCITAVCVVAIPNGETRFIDDLGVFAVTASFSVFAYAWLFFIVAGWTPEVVTIEEAVITFLFFPLLVFIAFGADKGWFSKSSKAQHLSFEDLRPEEIAHIEHQVRAEHKGLLTETQMARLIEERIGHHRSRAHYRVGAIRNLTGGQRVSAVHETTTFAKVMPMDTLESIGDEPATIAIINLACEKYYVLENCGNLEAAVELSIKGDLESIPVPIVVKYATKEGTAKHQQDYLHTEGELVFMPGDVSQKVVITIIDDQAFEEDEEFYLSIYDPYLKPAGNQKPPAQLRVQLGDKREATIGIIDDDSPGIVSWEEEELEVTEGLEDNYVECVVHRGGGCRGKVSCHYFTENAGAIAKKDFEPLDDILEFENGQSQAKIKCLIKSIGRYERKEQFRIILDQPTGGLIFNKDTDGGMETCILTITIQADPNERAFVDKVVSRMQMNYDKAQIGHKNWAEQFRQAIYVLGDEDDDESRTAGVYDYVMHTITVFWKVLFAVIPPSDYCDGWICFFCSLGMIGVVTLFIGDLASLLGCVMGLPDGITAITFVALGTSLPDTFASKAAAVQDSHADASIGNVTGSNSVNVFLGIGLSWSVGSVYWALQSGDSWAKKYGSASDIAQLKKDYPDGGKFAVKSGDLGFSVVIFCLCAVSAIFVLLLRRKSGCGELGGPSGIARATSVFLVFLWLLYVSLSAYKTFDTLKGDPCK